MAKYSEIIFSIKILTHTIHVLMISSLVTAKHFNRPGKVVENRIPAAPSLVVSGLNVSASKVTEQRGRDSATHTAVENPTTPAPTTTTLTPDILEARNERRRLKAAGRPQRCLSQRVNPQLLGLIWDLTAQFKEQKHKDYLRLMTRYITVWTGRAPTGLQGGTIYYTIKSFGLC